MKLSERLAAIADYVLQGERVADIGTDHGLLPIFLFQQKISPEVILTDIKPGPLKKARANLFAYEPEMKDDLRLGCGLDTLGKGEVDTVIIAGMGGVMISRILEADPLKTKSFARFILQPRNGQDKLRMWLYKHGYTITKERLVREKKYICEIMVVETALPTDLGKRKAEFEKRLRDLEFEISPLLFSSKDALLKELIECKIRVEESIIESVRSKGSESSLSKLAINEERVVKLQELRKRIPINSQ